MFIFFPLKRSSLQKEWANLIQNVFTRPTPVASWFNVQIGQKCDQIRSYGYDFGRT